MIATECCGDTRAGGRVGPRGPEPLRATVVVEPVEEPTIEPPVIDTWRGRWIHGINRMAAESEASGDSFLGDGFVPGPDMAVAIGRPYAAARTTIGASGRVEHVSEYGGADESGAVCFPFTRHCRRAEIVIKIAGEVVLQHGYAGGSRVIMNISCARRSRIMTTEGYCFYRELDSVDSSAHPSFSTQRAWLFTGRRLRDECRDIAVRRMDDVWALYNELGEYVRHDGTPV